MGESSKTISALIKGISRFDGTPHKFQDWKRSTRAVLRLVRPDIFTVLDGAPRPQENFSEKARYRFDEESADRDTRHQQGHTAPALGTGGEEDEDQDEGEVQGSTGATGTAGQEAKNQAAGSLPAPTAPIPGTAHDTTAPRSASSLREQELHLQDAGILLNGPEIAQWDQHNGELFSILLLTTDGAAGSLMTRFDSKSGYGANGQQAWNALVEKYENDSSQRRRTLTRRLDNSAMNPGEDPDIFFVRIDQLIDDLETLGEPITRHRKMDIILSGLSNEYNMVRFQAMKDSKLSLEDLIIMMRNLYVNGLTQSRLAPRGSAMYTETSDAVMDTSNKKCHRCGNLGHFKFECHNIKSTSNKKTSKQVQNDRQKAFCERIKYSTRQMVFFPSYKYSQ